MTQRKWFFGVSDRPIYDSEVLAMSQTGMFPYDNHQAVLEMGGRDIKDTDHMITEVAIRGFYQHYKKVMGL